MNDTSVIASRVVNGSYIHTNQTMPDQPWWDNLDCAFHKYQNDFDLDLRTRMLVNTTAYADVATRTLLATLLTGLCMPLMFNPFRQLQDQQQVKFYKALAHTRDAGSFFNPPAKNIEVQELEPKWHHFKPDKGSCVGLKFDSPFQTVNPSLSGHYLKNSRNRVAWAQHWRHSESPRPTICVVHGFLADPYWVNSKLLELPWLYSKGYDVLLYTLPFHGNRQGHLSPFSGHGLFSGGISHLNEAMAHAVHDFRVFLDYLEDQGVEQFGVTGISLGGYTSALLAAVEDRLAFSIPNVPVVSMTDLFLEWAPASWLTRGLMNFNSVSVSEARHQVAVHSPLSYAPVLPRERLMIVGGAGDRLAPPKHARLLWDHWHRCRIHWFPGNHVIHLDKGKYLKEMLGFLRGIDFQ